MAPPRQRKIAQLFGDRLLEKHIQTHQNVAEYPLLLLCVSQFCRPFTTLLKNRREKFVKLTFY
jgi:hypothetical protein